MFLDLHASNKIVFRFLSYIFHDLNLNYHVLCLDIDSDMRWL
jgi:hypothetical protein